MVYPHKNPSRNRPPGCEFFGHEITCSHRNRTVQILLPDHLCKLVHRKYCQHHHQKFRHFDSVIICKNRQLHRCIRKSITRAQFQSHRRTEIFGCFLLSRRRIGFGDPSRIFACSSDTSHSFLLIPDFYHHCKGFIGRHSLPKVTD